MATIISRSQLSHPDLGATGGSGLHTAIANMYTTLGDNAASRYDEQTSIADSTTIEIDHNFGATLDQLDVLIYTGTGSSKTQVLDIVDAGWVVAGKTGELSTVIEVTTPGSGGPHTFTVVIIDGKTMPKAAYQLLVNTPANPIAETVKTWFDNNKRGIIQDSAGGLQPLSFLGTSYTSSAANAVPGVNTLVRSDIAPVTVTLPATMANYDIIMITDAGRNANSNNITIARNGNTIDGETEDYIIADNGGWIILIGDSANSDWVVLTASQSGGGSGFRNYFTNPDMESNALDGITAAGGTPPTIGEEIASP
ncbi:MAG TPA: hypothetical protein VMW45_03130, partial [Dehalococcoidia bacterium]|nr:hypothetical protein [Dehalococcoidia bacterium]